MVFTWSENPYSDMWNQLMFLSKKNNAKRLLAGEIHSGREIIYDKGKELERKASQVSFGINQAFEYYRAAESATIATSPMLFFYGMLSLAKALIVANKKGIFFEDIKYHGLTQINKKDAEITEYRQHPEKWELECEFAITKHGVSEFLTDLTNGFHFPNLCVIKFKDVISICPEISQMYKLYYGEPPRTAYLYSFEEITKDPYKIIICLEGDVEDILARIPELGRDFDLSPNLRDDVARVFESKNLAKFPDYFGIYYPPVGGKYVVGGLKYRIGSNLYSKYVDQAVADYFGFYILSMCVRYQQDFWGEIIQGEKSGIIGLVELYISVVKRRFPNYILDSLFGQKFRYGRPARFM